MSGLRFVEKLANAPWLCSPEHLDFLHSVFVAYVERAATGQPLDREAVEQTLGRPLDNTRAVTVKDGVARIPVEGTIVRRASLFTEISGGVSTEAIAKDFTTAYNDSTVHSILFAFDTPGGEATGISELASLIREKRDAGEKRIEAYCDGTCASAGYWLASATERITVDATAQIGSIGVVTRVKNPEAAGKKRDLEFWNARSPKKRIDPNSYEGQAAIQEYVDDMGDEFIAAVAENRGVSFEKVVEDFGQGFVMTGRRAVEAGMADAVGTEGSVVGRLQEAARGAPRLLVAASGSNGITYDDDSEKEVATRMDAQTTYGQDGSGASFAGERAEGILARVWSALTGEEGQPPTMDAGRPEPGPDDVDEEGSGEPPGAEADAGEESRDDETREDMTEATTRAADERGGDPYADLPEGHPLRARIEESERRAQESERRLAKIEEDRDLEALAGRARAAGFAEPEEWAPRLRAISRTEGGEETVEKMLAEHRAMRTQVEQANLFRVIHGAAAEVPGSALAEATKLAREKAGRGEARNEAAARAQVWRERPDLKERADAEQRSGYDAEGVS